VATCFWVSVAFLSSSIPFAVLVGRWALGGYPPLRRRQSGRLQCVPRWRQGEWSHRQWAGSVERSGPHSPGLPSCAGGGLPLGGLGGGSWACLFPLAGLSRRQGHRRQPGIWLALLPRIQAFWALAAAFLFWLALVRPHAWMVTLAFLSLGPGCICNGPPTWVMATWGGNAALVIWKHRGALHDEPLQLRPWLPR